MSVAVAETVVTPDTVAEGPGEVIDTVGGVKSFDTVTDTAAEVVRFPAASRAVAVNAWTPFANVVVFHNTRYGAVSTSAPCAVPSTKNCTPTTPTLSDADAVIVTVPATLVPFRGAAIDTVGGVMSGFATVTDTVADVVRLPAASRATAVNAWAAFVNAVVFQET